MIRCFKTYGRAALTAILFWLVFRGSGQAASSVDTSPPPDVPTDLGTVVQNASTYVASIAGVIAVLFIIIGGVRYITSMGNDDMRENAKRTLTRAIIGAIVVLLAYVIIYTVNQFLTMNP